MSHRPHVYILRKVAAESPPSPNLQIPWVTVEIRIYAPSGTPHRRVHRELYLAVAECFAKIDRETQWPREDEPG